MNADRTRGIVDELRMSAARAVAAHEVPDDVLEQVGARIAELPTADIIRGIDVCTHGICVDYFVEPRDWREILFKITDSPTRIRRIDWFPWGITTDDLIQIRVEYQMDVLSRKAVPQDPIPARRVAH
jgi:hypothetical protein